LLEATTALMTRTDIIAAEITREMGRPIRFSAGEVAGFAHRARAMIALAPEALSDITIRPEGTSQRFIRREPLGVVLALCAWNYPYLIAANTVIPALMAGNSVILKHADQTPSCPERLAEAFSAAGLPEGVFQYLHMDHDLTATAVADPRVSHVAFTGSVSGGRAVHRAAGGHFKTVGLELGGNDPAYVRADADLDHAVDNLVDGAMFNSGQSCCGIERIYVHSDLFTPFVERFVEKVRAYVLGDPRDPETTLGPVVRPDDADRIRAVIADAVARGARPLVDPALFPLAAPQTPYVAPQVLVDVADDMALMREETFGPVVGIASVDSDEEALARMNDSHYGLTASIWTRDEAAAIALGEQLETGTVFMNRCDYLDPSLAWVGVKNSGRGCTLSSLGYGHLTRPKSYHLRRQP
jgi:acyl-CoA reductase-like NAD-dependent aldehyde dehydrogenase